MTWQSYITILVVDAIVDSVVVDYSVMLDSVGVGVIIVYSVI